MKGVFSSNLIRKSFIYLVDNIFINVIIDTIFQKTPIYKYIGEKGLIEWLDTHYQY